MPSRRAPVTRWNSDKLRAMASSDAPLEVTAAPHKRIARYSAYNLVPLLTSVLAAVAAPLVASGFGLERYGLLAVLSLMVGYSALFDLGISRALTTSISRFRDASAIGSTVQTGVVLATVAGLAGGVVVALAAQVMISNTLATGTDAQRDAAAAVIFVACIVPLLVITNVLRGVLEGLQYFAIVNAMRLLIQASVVLIPVVLAYISPRISSVMMVICFVYLAAVIMHVLVCLRKIDLLVPGSLPILRRSTAVDLLRFGSWLTVTSIVGPVLVSVDRLTIAVAISSAAVSYYVLPNNLVSQLLVLPDALATVLLTIFPTLLAGVETLRLQRLYDQSCRAVLAVLAPVAVCLVGFRYEALSLWMGADFAGISETAMAWLAAGVLCNAVARMPFTLLLSAGLPRVPAILHIVELPFYLPLMYFATLSFGINGAAAVWAARMLCDMGMLFVLTHRHLGVWPGRRASLSICITATVLLAATASAEFDASIRVALVGCSTAVSWTCMLSAGERLAMRKLVAAAATPITRRKGPGDVRA